MYEAQQKFLRWAFLHESPEFVKAFHEGFQETYLGPWSRYPKMPLDPARPFFTDPLSDMIRDQHEIIDGRRHVDWHEDVKKARDEIMCLAQKTVSNKSPAVKEPSPPSSRRFAKRQRQLQNRAGAVAL